MADQNAEAKITISAQDLATDVFKRVQASAQDVQRSTESLAAGVKDAGAKIQEGIEHPLETAKAAAVSFAESLGPTGIAVTAIGGVAVAVGTALFELTAHAVELGAQLNDLSEITAIPVESLVGLKFASDVAGGSIESTANLIFMMQKRMAESPDEFQSGLHRIGLTISDIQSLSPDQQFLKIAEAFRENTDQSNRAATAVELFSRQGRDAIPLLMKPLSELNEEGKRFAEGMGENAGKSEELEMAWNKVKASVAWVGADVGFGILNFFDGLNEKIEQFSYLVSDANQKDSLGRVLIGELPKVKDIMGSLIPPTNGVALSLDGAKRAERDLAEQLKAGNDERKKAAAATDQYEKAVQHIVDTLQGHNEKTGEMVDALQRVAEDGLVLGTDAANRFADAVRKLSEAGVNVPGNLRAMAAAADEAKTGLTVSAAMTARLDEVTRGLMIRQMAAIPVLQDWAAALPQGGGEIEVLASRTLPDLDITLGLTTDEVQRLKDALIAYRQAQADASESAGLFGTALESTLAAIPDLIERGLTGGGGLAGAGKAIGAKFGGDLGKGVQEKLWEQMGSSEDGGNVLTHMLGDKIGGALTTALPGIGAMIGPAVGKLFDLIGNIGGPSKEELEGRGGVANFAKSLEASASAAQKAEIAAAAATGAGREWASVMIRVRDAYVATGHSEAEAEAATSALFSAEKQGGAAVQTQLSAINTVFDQQKQKIADTAQKAKDTETAVGGIVTAAQHLGATLPPALKESLDHLAAMPGITDKERDAINGLTAAAKPNFGELEGLAKSFGVELGNLGPKFTQAHVDDEAKKIKGAFDQLTDAGASVGGVLFGMKNKIGDLVGESLKFGTAIPDSMRPLIEELIRSGNLTDTAGHKFTDLSQIHFEDTPIDEGMTLLQTKIDDLTTSLNGPAQSAIEGVASALAGIPDRDVYVRVHVEQFGQLPNMPNTPQPAEDDQIPHFANEAYDISQPTHAIVGDAPGDPESVMRSSSIKRLIDDTHRAAAAAGDSQLHKKIGQLTGIMEDIRAGLKKMADDATADRHAAPAMMRHALRGIA
jgi:hypothetical protein